MQSVTQAPIKARYALVYDEPCTIAKVGGRLYVVFEDRIEDFAMEMAPFKQHHAKTFQNLEQGPNRPMGSVLVQPGRRDVASLLDSYAMSS